jgi:hypothetical protein
MHIHRETEIKMYTHKYVSIKGTCSNKEKEIIRETKENYLKDEWGKTRCRNKL